MEDIAHRTVVQDHHLAQIGFHGAQVFDVRAIAERAVLPVVAGLEVLPLLLEPVDHGVRVLLNTRRENNKFIPLADLAQEVITVRSLVYIVQDGVLRPQRGLRPTRCQSGGHGHRELHLNHVAAGHAATLGERVDESLVEIQNQGLLRELGIARGGCI